MAIVLCVWSNVEGDAALEWYENEYIPLITERTAKHTLHCEIAPTGLEGDEAGTLDAPWKLCTVYELRDDVTTEQLYQQSNHPPDQLTIGLLKDVRWDVRTYVEQRRWQAEDWDGSDITAVCSVAVMEWRVAPDRHDEVLHFYVNEAAPTIASSPDVLRFRLLKLETATVREGSSTTTLDNDTLDTYLTLVELECEDWPWDVVVALAEKPKWREFFDGQAVVKWKSSHYEVRANYPEGGSNATFLDWSKDLFPCLD